MTSTFDSAPFFDAVPTPFYNYLSDAADKCHILSRVGLHLAKHRVAGHSLADELAVYDETFEELLEYVCEVGELGTQLKALGVQNLETVDGTDGIVGQIFCALAACIVPTPEMRLALAHALIFKDKAHATAFLSMLPVAPIN